MPAPKVSIVMPVFNTGAYLSESVASVLGQLPLDAGVLPPFELVVVDDHSTDPVTLEILQRVSSDARVTVLSNRRSRGAAGARNSGIDRASGEWIGFLDSDDVWSPHALAQRLRVIEEHGDARWIGARFKLWKPSGDVDGVPSFAPAAALLPGVAATGGVAPVKRLERPVEQFAESCMIGIMTVLVRRELIVEKGLFDETLPRAEDYHLWFKCAFDNDLWMLESDIALYRIHPASLTHGHTPRLLHEETMVGLLLAEPAYAAHRPLLLRRLDKVMQDHCYFYRGDRQYGVAFRTALEWIGKRPLRLAAWKELIAASVRKG